MPDVKQELLKFINSISKAEIDKNKKLKELISNLLNIINQPGPLKGPWILKYIDNTLL
jgi:hypothetical protein